MNVPNFNYSHTAVLHVPVFEVLFAFLQSKHTGSILQGDHLPVLDLEVCMQHLEGQLAAQMTAAACLCKLAFMELQEEEDTDPSHAYCDQLPSCKGFKAMIRCLEAGTQVWSCVCCQATMPVKITT